MGCHEGHPPRRGQGHAPAPAHPAHAEAHRARLRAGVPPLPDRPRPPGARDRRGGPQPQLPAAAHPGRVRRRPGRWASRSATSSSRAPSGTGGAIKYATGSYNDTIVVFNGDVMTQVDLAEVHPPAPRAQGQGHDRADAGRQPDGLRPGGDRRGRQRAAVPREAEARGDHLRHDQRRRLRPRARDVRSDPEGHGVVDRAQLLPVARRAQRDVRRLRLSRLLDRHRHAGEVHAGAPRHHGPPVPGRAVRRAAARVACRRRRRARSRTAPSSRARASSTRAPSSRPAPASCPTASSAATRVIEEDAVVDGAIIWPNGRIRATPSCAGPSSAATATSAATPSIDRGVILGDKSAVTDYSRLAAGPS